MRSRPTVAAALVLFAVACVLNIAVGYVLFLYSRNLGILVSELLSVLLPALIAADFLAVDRRVTFRLHSPRTIDLVLALPLAVSLSILNDQLSNLTGTVYPIPKWVERNIVELLRASSAFELTVRILGVGLVAAVSEELLFRGFIQQGLEPKLGRAWGVVVTALLFAFIHVMPWGFPGYTLAGVVLGVCALATRSIFVPIAIHFLNNLGAVLLINFGSVETLGDPVWTPTEVLAPAALVFVVIMAYYVKRLKPAEERGS